MRVLGRYSGTIAADGTVTGLNLVPNDVITPAGTYYTVTITVRTPVQLQSTSTEQWSITTSPDPINIGAVQRLETIPALQSLSNPPREVTVCTGLACDATVICGMTIGGATGFSCGDPDDQCVAGSAVAIAKAMSPTESSPVTIRPAPGVYPECVAIDNTSYIELALGAGVVIRPNVTDQGQVKGGVVRIANLTTTAGATHHIRLTGPGTIWNDDFAPFSDASTIEAAVQIGPETIQGQVESRWNHISVEGLNLIANGQPFVAHGAGHTSTKNVPMLDVRGNTGVGGKYAIVVAAHMDGTITGNRFRVKPNFCEQGTSAVTGYIFGTVVDDGGSFDSTTSQLFLDANAPATDHLLDGRAIAVYGGNCSSIATEPAFGAIGKWTGSTRRADLHQPGPAATGSNYSNCSYVVFPVANADANSPLVNGALPGCSDKDWGVLRSARTANSTNGAAHAGILISSGNGTGSGTPSGSTIRVSHNVIVVDHDDFGSFGTGCMSSAGWNTSAGGLGGIVAASTGSKGFPRLFIENNSISARANVMVERDGCGAARGVFLGAGAYVEPTVVRNNSISLRVDGDPHQSAACVGYPDVSGATPVIDGNECTISSSIARHVGLAQSGSTSSTLVLATGASSANDTYRWGLAHMLSGACAGQTKLITAYTGSSRTATVSPNWNGCTPASTDRYIAGRGGASLLGELSVGFFGADTAASERAGRLDLAFVGTDGNANPVNALGIRIAGGNGYLGAPATIPGGWSTIATLSAQAPMWSSTSATWATGDLVCTSVRPPAGVNTVGTASINVVAAESGDNASVCLYTADGESLLGSAETISVASTGIKTGAFADNLAAGTGVALSNSTYWLCLGASAAGTLTVSGRPAMTLGTGTVGRLGTGGATCPLTIAPASMTAWTTVIPEVVLTP